MSLLGLLLLQRWQLFLFVYVYRFQGLEKSFLYYNPEHPKTTISSATGSYNPKKGCFLQAVFCTVPEMYFQHECVMFQ